MSKRKMNNRCEVYTRMKIIHQKYVHYSNILFVPYVAIDFSLIVSVWLFIQGSICNKTAFLRVLVNEKLLSTVLMICLAV